MAKAINRDLRIHLTAGNDAEFRMQVAEIGEALTRIGTLELLKYGEDLPCCLACGGVRYVEPPGCSTVDDRPCQQVYDLLGVFNRKRGTCLDLAPARAARHRYKAIQEGRAEYPASEVAWTICEDQYIASPHGSDYDEIIPGKFHALVELADGTVEDPSEELQANPGMCAGSCGCERRAE